MTNHWIDVKNADAVLIMGSNAAENHDIAFLGGMINHVLRNNLFQREYVGEYTNASFLLDPAFGFKDGYFTGWDPEKKTYDRATWKFQVEADGTPKQDGSLRDPHTVFQH